MSHRNNSNPQRGSRNFLDKLRTKPAEATVALMAILALSACNDKASTTPSSSETTASVDAVAENGANIELRDAPEHVAFSSLEDMDEGNWKNAVSTGVLDQVSWYAEERVMHPDADIEKTFTDNPNGEFAQAVDELVATIQTNAEVGDTGIVVAVGQIASDYDNDPENNSSLFSDTTTYSGMSVLEAVYSTDPSMPSESVLQSVGDDYEVVQLEDGTLRIN